MHHRHLFATVLALALSAAPRAAGAEPLASIPNPRVQNGTWVVDNAGALQPETIARINATIGEFERATSGEMAVVVMRSLDGMSIEEAASKLFEMWGIGKKDTDNGLLLLWSPSDRKIRVEVGYGLEGNVPDGKAGAILDAYVIPRFRAGNFDDGIAVGVDMLLMAARAELVPLPVAGTGLYNSSDGDASWPDWLPLAGAIPVGLGSLIGFRRWRRYRRRRCPQCRTRMDRLLESEDDALLEAGQVAEERVGSVDYDVWRCPSCAYHFTLRYPKWTSQFQQCPQCHNHTASSTEQVIMAPSTHGDGRARVVEMCAFCNYMNEHTKILPRIEESSSSSSSSSSSWSSGSSSSSSSSFGGGSSGGGGASRGY